MRSRSCLFATHVEERQKPWAASSDLSRRHLSEQQSGGQPAFMTSRSHPTGEDEVDVADLRVT